MCADIIVLDCTVLGPYATCLALQTLNSHNNKSAGMVVWNVPAMWSKQLQGTPGALVVVVVVVWCDDSGAGSVVSRVVMV